MPAQSLLRACSRASSSCWRATLARVPATPVLLGSAPAGHPVGETGVAIIGCACGANWGAADVALTWTTFAVHAAAPLLLANRPAHHPVLKAIGAIVRVCGRWRRCDLTAKMMMLAAPIRLDRRPTWVNTNCAIEGNLGRPEGLRWHRGPDGLRRLRWRGCWRRRWRWRWRRCRLWDDRLWDDRSLCGWAADIHGAAAEVLLLLRPDCGGCWRCEADGAIEDAGCCWP